MRYIDVPSIVTNAFTFPWPVLPNGLQPVWTGSGFRAGAEILPVLAYGGDAAGWCDSLTQLHEDTAGADHPIDRLSRRWAVRAVQRHAIGRAPVLLEVGSSSGYLLRDLRAACPHATIIGSDFVAAPLQRLAAHAADLPLIQFDLVHCPLPDRSMDAVIALNVLEHIDDDVAAARQIARILTPGGVAIVELPAGPHLYDAYDAHLRHYRRYTAADVRSLLTRAGLDILEQTHLGCLVYPAFAWTKRRNQRAAAADPDASRRLVETSITSTRSSRLLRAVLGVEAGLGRILPYPVGIRSVTVARQPGSVAM